MTTVAFAASVGGPASRSLVELVALVGRGSTVVSARRAAARGLRVDALVGASPGALRPHAERWSDAPSACLVADAGELQAARALGVEVPLTTAPDLVDRGALLLPTPGIDLDRFPVLPPLTRRRRREAAGLPDLLVLAVDGPPSPDRTTSLALASAAVVGAPLVPLALALGTPGVVLAEVAEELDLHDGVEVVVAASPDEADRLAARLAADEDRAAALSRRARSYAERHLDLAVPARAVRRRLGLEPPPSLVDRRLAELGTPSSARIRGRVAAALAPFPVTLEAAP